MRPRGSTEKADLAVACVLCQRPSTATEVTRILSSWAPKWRHPRSTVYCALDRFLKWELLEKKHSGRSVVYSFTQPRAALDKIWQSYCKRYYAKQPQPRGPARRFRRDYYLGLGYQLAARLISKQDREKLAEEIAPRVYAPEMHAMLSERMVTTELEKKARALLKQQATVRRGRASMRS